MKILHYSAHSYIRLHLSQISKSFPGFLSRFTDVALSLNSVDLAEGYDIVTVFSQDKVGAEVLSALQSRDIKCVLVRATGYDHVDLEAAKEMGISVANAPAYSPESIAEHALMLMLALAKQLGKSLTHTAALNFDCAGMVGINIGSKTIGVLGTGNIGMALIKMLQGFGCRVVAFDIEPDRQASLQYDFEYVTFDDLIKQSNILSLHIPLSAQTRHIIGEEELSKMLPDSILVNTSRGGLIDTTACYRSIQEDKLFGLGMDVYENEKPYFFRDCSQDLQIDPLLVSLIEHERILLTGHRAFLTEEALRNISQITYQNALDFHRKGGGSNFIVSASDSEFEVAQYPSVSEIGEGGKMDADMRMVSNQKFRPN